MSKKYYCVNCQEEITDKKKLAAIDMLERNGSRTKTYCRACYTSELIPKRRGAKKYQGDKQNESNYSN